MNIKIWFLRTNHYLIFLLSLVFIPWLFNLKNPTSVLNVLAFSNFPKIDTLHDVKHAISKGSSGKPRSTPLNGKRIPAFESLPGWISDSRFSKHITTERKKVILEKIKEKEEQIKLNEAWCQLLTELVGKNEKEDVHFMINPFQVCKKNTSTSYYDSLLNNTKHIIASNTSLDLTAAFIDVHPTNFPKFSLAEKLHKKQHLVEAFSQTVELPKGNMGLSVNPYQHDYMFKLGQPKWAVQLRNAEKEKITEFSSGFNEFQMDAMTSAYNEEVSVGVGYEKYGVFVDRSIKGKSTSVGFLSPNVETTTMADFNDHQYGQRFRIKNFEINLRHDFDEAKNPDPEEYSTEFLVGYKDTGVMLVSDIHDKVYGFGVHVRGHQVSLLHDFDDFVTQAEAKTKKGFKFSMGYDLPDKKSKTISAHVGVGLPKSAFVQIGMYTLIL
jgi:hypothetical protein